MPHARRRADDLITRALAVIGKRFNLHLRLAREMHQDGYLRIIPFMPDHTVHKNAYSQNRTAISIISHHYGISSDKLIKLFNNGYVNLDGLDYKKAIFRYRQQHA